MALIIIITFIFEYAYILVPLAILIVMAKTMQARKKTSSKHNDFIALAVSETSQLQNHNQLAELAKSMGLTYTPGTLSSQSSLQGTYRDIPVSVYDERHAIGERFVEITFFKASLNNTQIPAGLRVSPKSASATHSIPFGDPQLDQAFVILGAPSSHTRAFFERPSVKDCFLELHALASSFCLDNNTLSITYERGLNAHQHLIREHLESLVRCAHTVNGTRYLNAAQPSPTPPIHDTPQNESFNPW